MQTIEYDLNVSGGLMPQINALTAPPTSDESNRRRKLKKSISRQNQFSNDSNNNNNNFANNRQILSRQTKTGKAPNHEYCDSCREGGDLLCCDRCPNAFHLQCHDPPLDEEDVPQGEWLCRKCKLANNDQLMVSEEEDSDDCDESDEWSESRHSYSRKSIQKPFSLLIRAAQTLNPKQFQLPNDMTPSIQLIGTSKRVNHNNKTTLKKQFHEMDNNLVSFPVKLCYQCSKSCRKATLIQCDYCPLLFHADCLDPPLPVLPTGRWMCPNHPQHISEQKLLDSVRLTERVKLWNQFSGPISQDTIKLDFLRKVHRKDPVFRIKTCLPPKNRVKVPEAIKEMYKRRPKLLPNINTLTAYDSNYSNSFSSKEVENECLNSHQYERPTLEQQEEWLSSLIAFQSSVAQYISSQKHFDSKHNSCLTITSTTKDNELSSKSNETSVKLNSQNLTNGPTDHSSNENNSLKKETNSDNKELMTQMVENMRQLNGNKSCSSPTSSPSLDKRISIPTNCLNTNIESIADINKLDDSLVRVLAFQRIQQLNNRCVESNHNSISAQNLNPIHSFQTTVRRIGLNDVRARAVLCPILIKSSTGSSSGPTIVMSYRTLTIGTSSENDVILGEYGHCNYVSARHASIFYDETSRNYELINYSEHGTTVDNVLYSCDFSDKKVHNPKHSNINSQSVSTVKAIIGSKRKRKSIENNKRLKNSISNEESNSEKNKSKLKRKSFKSKEIEENAQKANELKTNKIVFRKDYDSENVERVSAQTQSPLTMSSKARHAYKPCACKSSCSSLIGPNGAGWEGTALLHHGSHLKIGCNQFIFSITNHGITANPTIQSTPNPSTPAKSQIKTECLSSK